MPHYQIDGWRNMLMNQMKEGLVVIPNEFECQIINQEDLDCEIGLIDEKDESL